MTGLKSYWLTLGGVLAGLCSQAWAAALPYGQIQTGTISSAAQSNSYNFSANVNDVVDFTIIATSGSLSPKIKVYNPAGVQVGIAFNNNGVGGCAGGSTLELNTLAITASGSYTVLVSDCGDTNTGGYLIYAQRTNNPAGAVALSLGGQPQTGTISSAAQSNSYSFSASVNDVVNFTVVTTNGIMSPKIRVYNPAGTLLGTAFNNNGVGGCAGGSTIELNQVTLPATGAYTVLVGDCGDTNSGVYNLSAQCFGVCTGPPAFFNNETLLGSGVYYLQFTNNSLFGYYTFTSSSILYHYDLGFEAFVPGSNSDLYFFDFTSGHWWYTSSSLFPYIYDFTLNTWIYYFPDTKNSGHYTTNPRSFVNLTTSKIFTM